MEAGDSDTNCAVAGALLGNLSRNIEFMYQVANSDSSSYQRIGSKDLNTKLGLTRR